MAEPQHYETHKDLLEQVMNRGYYYYPLVFVNDELKLAGSAEYYEVLYVIRELLGSDRN